LPGPRARLAKAWSFGPKSEKVDPRQLCLMLEALGIPLERPLEDDACEIPRIIRGYCQVLCMRPDQAASFRTPCLLPGAHRVFGLDLRSRALLPSPHRRMTVVIGWSGSPRYG
jgi:hypothetical protein